MEKQQVYNFLKKNGLLEEAESIFLKYNHYMNIKYQTFDSYIDLYISKYNKDKEQLQYITSSLYNKSITISQGGYMGMGWKFLLTYYKIHRLFKKWTLIK